MYKLNQIINECSNIILLQYNNKLKDIYIIFSSIFIFIFLPRKPIYAIFPHFWVLFFLIIETCFWTSLDIHNAAAWLIYSSYATCVHFVQLIWL